MVWTEVVMSPVVEGLGGHRVMVELTVEDVPTGLVKIQVIHILQNQLHFKV